MTNRIIVFANLSALCLLFIIRLRFKVPTQLVLVIAVIFMMCSMVIWIRNAKYSKTTVRLLAQLLTIWGIATILVLGGTFYFDRGGWLWFKLTGYNLTLAEDFSDSIHLSLKNVTRRHPFLVIAPENPARLTLPKGDYRINNTIVIPPGAWLTIEPGARLRFNVGRSLISYSPITAKGTKDDPIIFTAKNKWLKWGVVAVVNTGASEFEYARFEHGRQALVNNIMFPGCLSIIESEVKIIHSQFINLYGKDAVYVRKGKVFIHNNVFRRSGWRVRNHFP
jgi:hypothetical protein